MKRAAFVSILLAVAGVAQAITSDLRYHLPANGVSPSAASFEMFSYLHERHGSNSLALQKYEVSLQLSDPRRSGYKDWMFNAALDLELSHLHAGGFNLRKRELYDFALPLSVIHPFSPTRRLIVAAAPTIATDFVKWERAWSVNGFAEYKITVNDRFSYAFGFAVTPRVISWGIIPAVSFDWKPNDDWRVKLGGARLTAMRQLPHGWSAGFFATGVGGSWTVTTEGGDTRIFRVRSLVAGATAEWDFSRPGQTKRVLSASVGMPVVTTAEFCRFNANKKTLGKHHYGTGVYAAAAVDFRF